MAKYKVAVATNDGVNVNVHFGHAAAFDIYEVDDVSGKFEKVEVRVEHSSMFAAAKNLADLDYVLCQQLGPQAIQSLARFNVRAFDIALPIDEAIAKINLYRKKLAERLSRIKGAQNSSV